MKKNITELIFILDRSGSMAGLESDTMTASTRCWKGRRMRLAMP